MTDEYTAWKASQARPWAESVRKAVCRLRQREAALEEVAARYDGLKATRYDKTGGGACGGDQLAAMVDELDAMRASWASALDAWNDEVAAFEQALRRIEPRYDALLTARYVRALPWAQVAESMGYDEVYARGELATAALAALFDAMPPHLRALPPAIED